MRAGAIAAYLDALSRGEPVAIGFTVLILAIAAGLGLLVWYISWRAKVEQRQHKERLRKKRGY
jgi:hypothetical protein